MRTGRGKFSAAASSLGYFYQCRYALLEALLRLRDGDRICIGIETLDDVVFQTSDSAVEVLQTKHHINAHANLTDGSPDLWKTLRVWIEGQSNGIIPQDAQLFLITTAVCKDGTAAAYLCPRNRDEEKALRKLSATASTSTSESNSPAYNVFRAMKVQRRERLVKSITILDGSPSIGELDEQMQQAVFFVVERKYLWAYIQRLEGWWLGQVVKHLQDDQANPILGEELEAEANRIREQFKEDKLPVDDDIMHATVDATGYISRVFVEQLKLIDINYNRIFHAIRNYYRAFEQRSRWVRDDLLYVGELDRYQDRLIEEWDLVFQQMRDKLGDEAAEEAKARAAQTLYGWVETGAHAAIRPAVTEPAVARGSYQILADDLRVGWHLEFRERLEGMLAVTEAG